ncbi:metallophosphoesterase [Candidatus Pacearchaeota archaeon]|nr:metallophosphoesterase [Candidatus Pacearchaeota archaeon]
MRILVIGDLHGEFPESVREVIKKEKIDLILSTGDFANFDNYRKIKFDKIDKTNFAKNKVKDHIQNDEYQKMINEIIKSMEKPLEVLDSFNIPVYSIYGNLDYTNYEVNKHKIKSNSLNRIIKKSKNIKLFREGFVDFDDLQILLFSGYRKNYLKYAPKKTKKVDRLNKGWKDRLSKIFSQIKPNKPVLFLFHDPPKDTKLDLINNPNSPMNGKHVGDEIIREFIEKYQPQVAICGHMHETQGTDQIKKSLVINAGYGRVGQFLILDINGDEIKYDLRK